MVMTPWGDSAGLRGRRMAPGRGAVRNKVRRNQQERLFGAMVATGAEKGYLQTSIEDLTSLSGVSSRAFYELFADKEDCFLATMEEILAATTTGTRRKLDDGKQKGQSSPSAELTIKSLVESVATQPAAAKLCIVSSLCAGERARGRLEQALKEHAILLQCGFDQMNGRNGMPAEMTRAILGGVVAILYRRLAEEGDLQIAELAPSISAWALSIPPPPRALRPKSRRSRIRPSDSPPFAAHVPGERVLRGFAAAVAEKGFATTTIAEVAARAQISQNTFYAHFRDKEDALYAALDSSGAQMVAATLPAVRRNPQWPGSLRVAMETICGFLTAEPDFAKLREVEVYAIGPEAVFARDKAKKEILALLERLAGPEGAIHPLAVEGLFGAVQWLLYERIRRGAYRAISEVAPLATYIALAPGLGAEDAWQVACG